MINREYMIKSILGYSQLTFYNNSEIVYWLNNSSDINFNISDINSKSFEILKKFHFIISKESIDFFDSLDSIITNLIISSKEKQEFKNIIPNGNINWAKTINTRLQSGYYSCKDYIYTKNKKTLNTIENILLKALLTNYLIFIDEILNISNKKSTSTLTYNLSNYKNKIDKILQNELFKNIDNKTINLNSKKIINSIHRITYMPFIRSMNLFIKVFIRNDMYSIYQLIAKQSLINLNDDKLYEIYCLFKIYSSLDYKCKQKEFNILGLISKNSYCAKYTFNNGTLEIRFQTLPEQLLNNKYSKLMKQCNLNISNKSPDIFLTWKPLHSKLIYHTFVEVKHSSDLNYFRNSIYKVFGYIHDFSNINNNITNGILLFSGIQYSTVSDDLMVLNNSDFNSNISKVLSNILKQD